MARNYNKIQSYHLAYEFTLLVYEKTNQFPESEKHNITSQIRRASVSIPLNIAEGSAKASKKEFVHYLNTAYGSAKEIEVLLNLCYDLNYFNETDYNILAEKLDELNAKLFLFIRNVESQINDRKHYFFKKFEENNQET
jgi:four helix bundle protein